MQLSVVVADSDILLFHLSNYFFYRETTVFPPSGKDDYCQITSMRMYNLRVQSIHARTVFYAVPCVRVESKVCFGVYTSNKIFPKMYSIILGGSYHADKFKALKTKSKILKSTRNWTGGQCREARTGVMCSRFLVPVNNLAAAFCTNCNRFREDLGRPR